MAYDLLIKGGTLVDPAQNIHANKDVAFSNGVVAEVGDDLSKTSPWTRRKYWMLAAASSHRA